MFHFQSPNLVDHKPMMVRHHCHNCKLCGLWHLFLLLPHLSLHRKADHEIYCSNVGSKEHDKMNRCLCLEGSPQHFHDSPSNSGGSECRRWFLSLVQDRCQPILNLHNCSCCISLCNQISLHTFCKSHALSSIEVGTLCFWCILKRDVSHHFPHSPCCNYSTIFSSFSSCFARFLITWFSLLIVALEFLALPWSFTIAEFLEWQIILDQFSCPISQTTMMAEVHAASLRGLRALLLTSLVW